MPTMEEKVNTVQEIEAETPEGAMAVALQQTTERHPDGWFAEATITAKYNGVYEVEITVLTEPHEREEEQALGLPTMGERR